MSTFVISKRYNGDYKFVFASRKGKTIFTSIACKHKSDCERMILGIKENMSLFAFTKVKKASNKFFLDYLKTVWSWLIAENFRQSLCCKKELMKLLIMSIRLKYLTFQKMNLCFLKIAMFLKKMHNNLSFYY